MTRTFLPALLILVAPICAHSELRSYSADSNTLHLWHLDDVGAPANDLGTSPLPLPVLAGGATLGNPSLGGFGTALSTFDSGLTGTPASLDAALSALPLVNGAGDNTTLTYSSALNGAFTFEALVRIDADLTQTFAGSARGVAPMHIFSGEGESNAERIWQLRLDPIGFNPNADGVTAALTSPALEFINVNSGAAQNRVTLLPMTGPNAVASGAWFHVAVAYDGNEGIANNLSIFWTRADPTRTTADLLIQRQLDTDLPLGTPDFAIGNIGRNPSASNFVGLIDEVRISDVARGPNAFIFVPEPSAMLCAASGVAFFAMRRRRG